MHHVVIVCLPGGVNGIAAAAMVAKDISRDKNTSNATSSKYNAVSIISIITIHIAPLKSLV